MELISTVPMGRLLSPLESIADQAEFNAGRMQPDELGVLCQQAVPDTLRRLEASGSPVPADGEQRHSPNFAACCIDGPPNFAHDGLRLPFVGHPRRWLRLTSERLPVRPICGGVT